MKKCLLICFAIIMLGGCSNNTEDLRELNMVFDIDAIKNETYLIEITDPLDSMYLPQLKIQVSEGEKKRFIDILNNLTPVSTGFSKSILYSVNYLDQNGNLLGTLMVDAGKTLKSSSGIYYKRDDIVSPFLDEIESKYKLDVSLLKRQPGEHYFDLLCYAESGNMYEITENNFISGLDIDFNKEEICDFEKSISKSNFSSEKYEIEAKYVIEIYSKDGGLLYRLFSDDNGMYYTDSGYCINHSSISKWFNKLGKR